MLAAVALFAIEFLIQDPSQQDLKALGPGIVTKSAKLARAEYVVPAPGDENGEAAVLVKGDNIVLDFNGATLAGGPSENLPDARRGVGLQLEGRNITLKNAKVRGYKVAVIAKSCPGLKIINCDFSFNWKQHLASTLEREDQSDWMSYHHNDKDEWLRHGAGLYLKGCSGFEISGTRITGGQCGLLMTESHHGVVWNNDFSFLSGLGIGMYQSSDNQIMHNRLDWCVRGYSHGVYSRGQDSSGILIYEQSSRNIFAYNSATHGGDGFFLWAGQKTMDTGKGGCNDNIVYGNDFSHSTANGIETTFSRNKYIYNKLHENDHGVWGGYSYDTLILANEFKDNNNGISIEHGQNNTISGNVFWNDKTGIHLWQNASQDPNWGYPKGHDTASHDVTIDGNKFVRQDQAIWLKDTSNVTAKDNAFYQPKKLLRFEGSTSGFKMDANRLFGMSFLPSEAEQGNRWDPTEFAAPPYSSEWNPLGLADGAAFRKFAPNPIPGGIDPFIKPGAKRGRKYILVDEWGPYDFRSPKLWLRKESTLETGAADRQFTAKSLDFEVLGPKGAWKVASVSPNVVVTPMAGNVGDMVNLTYLSGKVTDLRVELEYVGEETTDFKGVVTPAQASVKFGYRKFEIPVDWTIKFFKWSAENDPRTQDEAFKKLISGQPIKTLHSDKVDFAGAGFVPEVGIDHYATVAEGTITAPAGDYSLEVTTDDGCRVWVDDKPVITDAWKYQGPTLYVADVKLTGNNRIRIEHFQIDGFATLKVRLRPKN